MSSGPSVPEVRTERLLLRGWDLERHLDQMAAINADPETMQFIGGGKPSTREQSAAQMQRWIDRWAQNGYGLWAVELLEDERLAGWVGLNVPRDFPQLLPVVEVGWRLDRALWNRGYATEGARASVEFAWTTAGLDRVISLIHPDNIASIRVAEKLGMHDAGVAQSPEAGAVRVFELLAP